MISVLIDLILSLPVSEKKYLYFGQKCVLTALSSGATGGGQLVGSNYIILYA